MNDSTPRFGLLTFSSDVADPRPRVCLNFRDDGMPAGPFLTLDDPAVPEDVRQAATREAAASPLRATGRPLSDDDIAAQREKAAEQERAALGGAVEAFG